MKWLKRIAVALVLAILVAGIAVYQGDLSKDFVDAKYSSAASQFLDLPSGARIHYRDEGNSDGLSIVLIHGSNASLHTWEPWVKIIGEKYRIVTLDLPGHGLTGKTPDRDYTSANLVAAVESVVQHLGIDRFVLGGNSMGGSITWRYTLDHPEKVEAMILVNASGFPQWRPETQKSNSEQHDQRPLAYRLMRNTWFRAIARHLDPYRLTKQFVISCYGDQSKVTDKLIQRYYQLWLREGTREAIIDRFDGTSELASESVDPTQFTLPTLVMWGRDDTVIPMTVAEKFAAELPNNMLVAYDGVGHLPMEEIPTKSAADALEFLDKLSREPERTQKAVAE